ncbi:HHE domain protein [Aspergillus clavatus NRRL 1]|uniref:HHE domain protein n=1 Tax=Aspergillus clavatus (strain ATCC 1007 / CBS 513.65 / DSM 816 / NCTC 3887 / NRRL 1 / QM 1276 / 107) TaxID=344612 RepID=A1CLV5_ASPCL|nr:HHE domain protein [Aspergillus clavatus NRRL 1]EAW09084.1 HHE domain protein [Aspergillus clavatus NRRL 1]
MASIRVLRPIHTHLHPYSYSLPIARAVSTTPIMTGRITDTVKQDHRQLEACYDKIMHATDRDDQIRFQNLFTWELARHSIGEELVVYPAFEKHLPDGVSMADKDRREHQTVKEKLKKFQNLDPSNPEFMSTIKSLMVDLAQHIKEEETNDLVKLDQALSHGDSVGLSKSFERTKMFVPTRSHPSAPSKPPFETAVGLLTAPIDQLADLFRKWPHEGQASR